MPRTKKAKISEQEAKKELEKQTGVEFEYSRAVFDEDAEKWCFELIIPNKETARRFGSLDGVHKGADDFIVSEPGDFEPYKTLADHLKKPFFEVFDDHIWDASSYGYDWKLGTKRGSGLYCWTGEGWLEIAGIESAFLEKFGKFRKNLSMEDEEWSFVKIFKNCCYGTSYKKRGSEDEWATEYECELSFDDLSGSLIRPSDSWREALLQEQQEEEEKPEEKPEKPVEAKPAPEQPAVELVCAFCGAKLKGTSKFCPKCGLKVKTPGEGDFAALGLCPNCKAPIKAAAKYCPRCGARHLDTR